jgi:metal-sulfur cluster biosynthetic enzyme
MAGNPYRPESMGLLVSRRVIDPALSPSIFDLHFIYSINVMKSLLLDFLKSTLFIEVVIAKLILP